MDGKNQLIGRKLKVLKSLALPGMLFCDRKFQQIMGIRIKIFFSNEHDLVARKGYDLSLGNDGFAPRE